MDPGKKRQIRLFVALGAAVLLAAALVYTSFSASTEAKEPSQLLSASPGQSYEMTGKVVPGLGRAAGTTRCASASPTATAAASLPVTYTGHRPRPLPRRAARSSSPASVERRHLRRRAGHPGHQVPVEVHGGEECNSLGSAALALAFLTAIFAAVAALIGRHGDRRWVDSSRRAVYALCALLTVCVVVIEIAFAGDDFSFNLVAEHSSIETPTFYKLAAMWSSQEGSLLLWAWVLSIASSAALFATRNRLREIVPYATAVMMGDRGLLHRADAVRRRRQPVRDAHPAPADGVGLNPLLQHPSMMIHPPMLYSGYVAFTIPFAFAIGALVTRRLDAAWIRSTRRFALIAWAFLGLGLLLGARWSYTELGWGGYWAWDPVENAALMPWLIGTAFLHSIMVQEKRGMLKVWNASPDRRHLLAGAARHLPRPLRRPAVDPRLRRLAPSAPTSSA